MPERDSFGPGDHGLGVELHVPPGEEGRVRVEGLPGLEPVADEDKIPATPKPPDIVFEVVEKGTKGWGVFVSTQKAPLTIRNQSWYESADDAQAAVDALKADHGWAWIPPRYEYHEQDGEPYEDPNGDMVTPKERVKGDLIADGYWSNGYHLVFDVTSLASLARNAQ